MAEVINNIPSDSLDKSSPPPPPPPPPSSSAADSDLPPPIHPPPNSSYRRSRDRRDDRDFDRPPNRRDYYDRNMSPPLRDRDRDIKRRRSPSPPYRDRRHSPLRRSPSRRSPPHYNYKRSRRGGSPRGGYGPDDRSLFYFACYCNAFNLYLFYYFNY